MGNAKVNLRPSVTGNKLNNQKDVKESDTASYITFYLSKWPLF